MNIILIIHLSINFNIEFGCKLVMLFTPEFPIVIKVGHAEAGYGMLLPCFHPFPHCKCSVCAEHNPFFMKLLCRKLQFLFEGTH